jgi:ribosomal protein S18 acetylase RimI-like enzyme
MTVRQTTNQASLDEVLAHLCATDQYFTPPLSQRVNLPAYASKLCELAERDEVWVGTELVGLVATYCNDREHGAYISSVSVLPAFRGQGLADDLVQQAVARARDRSLPRVSLHLHPDNRAAMALYLRLGFAPGLTEGEQLTMTLNLDQP